MPPVLSLVPELALRPQKTLPLWLAIERFVGLNLNACLTLLSQVELSTLKNKHSRVAEECEQNKHMLDTVQRKLSTANLQVRFPAGGVSCARVWIQVFRLFCSVSKTATQFPFWRKTALRDRCAVDYAQLLVIPKEVSLHDAMHWLESAQTEGAFVSTQTRLVDAEEWFGWWLSSS